MSNNGINWTFSGGRESSFARENHAKPALRAIHAHCCKWR